jgi:hypothetical protein
LAKHILKIEWDVKSDLPWQLFLMSNFTMVLILADNSVINGGWVKSIPVAAGKKRIVIPALDILV